MRLAALFPVLMIPGMLLSQQGPGTVWDLQSCIATAIKNSLDVEQSRLNMEQYELTYRQSKMNRLPDLNASVGLYEQNGRSIDRFTNTYVQSSITSNNIQANSSVTLFAGGQLTNNIKYARFNWLASEQDLNNVEMNISLSVANYFLQVAQARELKKSYQSNLNNTKIQLDKAQKQFDAGVINEGNVLNLKAQQATDESNIINAENQERTALSNLKLLLRLPFEQNFDIELPVTGNLVPVPYQDTLNTIFDSAMTHRPDVQAAELRLSAYIFRKKAVAGALLPVLTGQANMSTVYSSSAKDYFNPHYNSWQTVGRLVSDTTKFTEQPKWLWDSKTTAWNKQINNNLGNWFGVSLSVPVFNKFQNSTNIKIAKLDVERYRIAYERSKQNLYNEVVTAYNSFLSAMNRFRAAKLSLEAQNRNLEFVQKRYDAGQAAALDLQIARASQATAQVNMVSVQYEYLFRRMVLDYYMGQKLEFK